jgi:ubiquinone/menaquinone biosynthesis C-methylase UbiE
LLARTLEPEVMDTEEDAAAYDAIDTGEVDEVFAARAVELAPAEGLVLDAGAGPGGIAVRVAVRAPGLRIVAIDLAEAMLVRARARVAGAGLGARVEVALGDVKATGRPDASFDMVMSNSTVHHLPDPLGFFVELRRLLRPGGAIFVKDLHRPASHVEWQSLVERHAAHDGPRARQLFADSLLAALTVEEVRALCDRAELDGVEVRRTSDRHWVVERRAS